MYLGLGLAHQQRIRKLHIKSDYKVLIDMVTKKNKLQWKHTHFSASYQTTPAVELAGSFVSHFA
jgi:hypothetical protein